MSKHIVIAKLKQMQECLNAIHEALNEAMTMLEGCETDVDSNSDSDYNSSDESERYLPPAPSLVREETRCVDCVIDLDAPSE
jgi:hypothetical protein